MALIRPAAPDDAEAIHAMLLDLARGLGFADKIRSTPDSLRHHGFGPAPAFHGLVAERDGAPVGVCLWFPAFSTFRGEPGIYVQDLYVAPSERGTGLGRQLLAAAAAAGQARGATHLRLSVEADNDGAQRFYAAQGLRWQDTERMFLVDGQAFGALATAAEDAR
ncbi:ribosomal protein S18 acetylase RimI-like enzyme [Inquilinus ginsengisoli]|uniref:Ribosomal protein S18 acetylase RimI-like enzyme n=1 Tax=Inquilinus ginsengisoli TaxID=363840 RepID=A0ABU1JKH5_9PROT|nr:GNAT family N-acetyltransferase [Inquilinus ginsengisoli]MDR6289121.1 ribosomal protein S18 acetylase RimI-like enzyme [Inquilinus ginsengisoli]